MTCRNGTRRRPSTAAWLLAGTILCGATPAIAEEWVYSARQGDSLWLLAREFLDSMTRWPAFRAMNDVPEPRLMPPGTPVRFPVQWLRRTPATATLHAFGGDTRVADAGGEPAPATVGQALRIGARVLTGEDGSAVLRFADGSTMLVRPGSEVVMDDLGLYGRRGMVDTRARLQHGRVESEVPPATGIGGRLRIITPSASALVRGTRFRVGAESGLSRVEVVEGRVQVAGGGARVLLPAATGTLVREGERPAPPRRLLPAPDLSPLAPLLERPRLRLGWNSVPGAAGYRAQIATLAATPPLLLDQAAEQPRLTLPALADGRYELRVRAVDADGLEGLESRRRFELDARPEPPATIEPRPEATVRVARAALRWSEPTGAAGYRLQVATNAGFSRLVIDQTVDGAPRHAPRADLAAGTYRWRVATVDESGEQGPWGDPQTFEYKPAPPAPAEAAVEAGEDGVLLRWQAGQPGQTYEVQLAADEAFAEDVSMQAVERPQLEVPVPERDLWFRVRVVEGDGYRGPFGTAQRIEGDGAQPWWLLGVALLVILL